MTQLLIQGSTIIAQGPFSGITTGDTLQNADQIIPKSVIPGYVIVDVVLPAGFSITTYQYVNGALQAYSPPPNPSDVVAFIKRVDTDTDAIYGSAIGNRAPEYDQASADANAYAAAGYTGTVPASVQSWATATGWTTTQAAQDIIASAAKLASARDAIRLNRLTVKQLAKNATTQTQLATAQQQWATFVPQIKSQLGI